MPEYFERTTPASQLARNKIWNELQGKWCQDDDFFPRFFPVSTKKSRWLRIPKDPKILSPRLYTALNELLNDILGYFRLGYDNNYHPRLFIRTYRCKVPPTVKTSIWPAILLAGSGPSFVNKTSIRPIADYRSGLSPLEVVLDNADMELARKRLVGFIQEIFNHQPNRRFAFGLVISTTTVTCYLFDHSGIVFSPPLNYHEHPDQFCALVGGLASINETDIGLDNSMFVATGSGFIRTRDPIRKHSPSIAYYVNGSLHHTPCIIGRGTTCFLAHEGDPETPYVIKDAWISTDDPELEGRETEGSLLFHAKSKGMVQGIAQICHYEEVRLKGSNGRLFVDDIYHIRRLSPSEHSCARQRVHTRIVMSTYGKPLEEFSSRKELLHAYYDAIRAHRNLYEVAGILHRDIKPSNILINANGEEGDRGILIDFDHAIRTNNTSPYSMRNKIGTYIFMSYNVIQGNTRHDYWDDLESFYYVLVYILTMFRGPHAPTKEVSDIVESWEGPSAWRFKGGDFLMGSRPFVTQPWFGKVFDALVDRLYALFSRRFRERAVARGDDKTPPPSNSIAESDEFLSHVRDAIVELGREEVIHDKVAEHPSGANSEQKVGKILGSKPRKSEKHGHRPTLASSRSLRQNVNYGRHQKI